MSHTLSPPQMRERARRACETCRISKRKCDNSLPCSHCVKKGLASTCMVAPVPKNGPHSNRVDQAEGLRPAHQTDPVPQQSCEVAPESTYPTPQHRDSSPSVELHPRILFGATGERVYVGSSAALSFLQFLRTILRRYNGPSSFTESLTRHSMLEAEIPQPQEEFYDFLDQVAKNDLVDVFLQASSGFIYLFTDADISKLLEVAVVAASSATSTGIPESAQDQDSLASLFAMIAIGAQCRGRDAADFQAARQYFTRAQQIVFRNMLLDPSLCMTTNFILLAFFMFCACRRNTALLYLGIAARSAAILGLHLSELNDSLPAEERNKRRRVWRSLRILDLHCNSILGRPTSTGFPPQQSPETLRACRDGDDNTRICHCEVALNANYDLCPLLESISHALTKRSSLDMKTAKDYLDLLRNWAQRLPGPLREGIDKDMLQNSPTSHHRRQTIGNAHVACGYYFAVLLVSRPFLVAWVVPYLHRAHQTSLRGPNLGIFEGQPFERSGNAEVNEMAQTCIGAAVYLVQVCQDSMSADLLLGNMTILQAWVLAAGLVLGFSLLLHREQRHPEAQAAFASSQDVLRTLSRLSPQAQRNLDILTSFSDAISANNSKIWHDKIPTGSTLLERILPRPGTPQLGPATGPSTAASGGEPSGIEQETGQHSVSLESFGGQVTDEIGFQQFWDQYTSSFPVQAESAGVPLVSWAMDDAGLGGSPVPSEGARGLQVSSQR